MNVPLPVASRVAGLNVPSPAISTVSPLSAIETSGHAPASPQSSPEPARKVLTPEGRPADATPPRPAAITNAANIMLALTHARLILGLEPIRTAPPPRALTAG